MVVVGTAYFLGTHKNNTPAPTQTTDQTANWKTYTNNDFGISFLYPADLYTPVAAKTFPSPINPKKFTDDLKTVPIISVTSNHPVGVDDQGPIMIQKLSNTTIDSWLGTNETAEKATNGSYFPVSGHVINKTTFQGLTAYLLKEKTNAQVPEDKYLVQAGKDVYYISFASDPPVLTDSSSQQYYADFDKNTKPIIEEILASMKFLSKT